MRLHSPRTRRSLRQATVTGSSEYTVSQYGTPGKGLPDLPGKVTALAFTGDGCVLAAGYDTGTCALFSMPERSLIRTVPAHSGAVTGLAILRMAGPWSPPVQTGSAASIHYPPRSSPCMPASPISLQRYHGENNRSGTRDQIRLCSTAPCLQPASGKRSGSARLWTLPGVMTSRSWGDRCDSGTETG